MSSKKEFLQITDLKDMLNKTKEVYGDSPAYKIRDKIKKGKYKIITHKETREMIDALGTALMTLGLKGKRIGVIGENRYEWQIAYLSVVCGTGVVVPFDKSLPENELKRLIERSDVEAIFYSEKYEATLKKLVLEGTGLLKHLISMDSVTHSNGVYSMPELIEIGKVLLGNGNREFLDAKINPEEMNIMLFTSGTTSQSKVVALSHKNICVNLMDLQKVIGLDTSDKVLSFLPLHHVFECTVGFLFSFYARAHTAFCDGIKYMQDNYKEYNITFAACVPAIFENMYKGIWKKIEKDGKKEEILELLEKHKDAPMEKRRKAFKYIHKMFGGNIKMLVSGAAAIDKSVIDGYRNFGINLCQGYGLTETSPVVGIETEENLTAGSLGKSLPSVEVKIFEPDNEGVGELLVKGESVMLGYYGNEDATKEAVVNGWFHTGDVADFDEHGYIFIRGRKKSVIVLKNGKNIFPEEMENIVNRIEGVKESFIFGKSNKKDPDDMKIYVKIVYDKEIVKIVYKTETEEEILKAMHEKIKEINETMPAYKSIRGIILSQTPLIKTTTSKIKRQEELKTIE